MTDDSNTSFKGMLAVLQRNPLKAIQLAGKAQRGVNRRTWEIASIACGFARILIDDEKHREDFYDEEFFDDRKRARTDKLLLHVFAYLYGALSGPAYNRASEHARALKKVCDDRDIKVADIPQYIEDHGGFDGLLSEQDEQEDDHEDNADESSKHGGCRSGIVRHPTAQGSTLTSDDCGLDDDDLVPDTDDDNALVARPQRKAPKPEGTEPTLKLLPRESLAGGLVVWPRAPLTMEDIWQALRKGKVTADFAMGETSTTHELYTGGGPFIGVFIEDFVS